MSELAGLDAVTEAVESGAGLPALVRSAAKALNASLAGIDAAGRVLAVAARSPAEERELIAGGARVQSIPLRLADRGIGTLRLRSRAQDDAQPSAAMLRLIVTMIASEVERQGAPERASQSAAGELLRALMRKELTDREQLIARAREIDLDLLAGTGAGGASVMIVRARAQAPAEEGWRLRARALAERGARAGSIRAIAALTEREGISAAEVLVLVLGADDQVAARAADSVMREMESSMTGCTFALGRSRVAADPGDLTRACEEAMLAANVADGGQGGALAFEDTGAYRLLLASMSESPGELRRFYQETVEPLVVYDEQYETELLGTLDAFLESDGNVVRTAQKLFTHRHTIYYRLERIRELTDLDVGSTDGREKLSLGLKSMRVLGLSSAAGPASEAGAAAGRVPRQGDRRPS